MIVLLMVTGGICAPWLSPHDPNEVKLANSLLKPSAAHPFGTDQLGRDVLARVLFGARVSVLVGVVAVGIAIIGGVPLGVAAGFYSGRVDNLIMRVMDIMLAFPGFLLALLVVSVLGPGLWNSMVAVGVASIPLFSRLTRGVVLSERQREYVEAARAIGVIDLQIMFRHIMPNTLSPLIVQATLRVATAILTAAGLSFLGLGAQPPSPEWGAMVSQGRALLQTAPWCSLFPGVAIMIFVLGLNLAGDGLNDTLNPRLRK